MVLRVEGDKDSKQSSLASWMELHELGAALFIIRSLYCGILYISIRAIYIREAELCTLLNTLTRDTSQFQLDFCCYGLNTLHTVPNSL